MNWADWAIVAILMVSTLISLKRGFVKEALSLLIWVAAFVVAMLFRGQLAILLADSIPTPSVREVVSFGILFASTLIVGAMVNYLIGELVKMTGLSGTDRLFGMVFGLARGSLIVLAILILLPGIIPVDQDPWWRESTLIPHFLMMDEWARKTSSDLWAFITSFFS